MEDVNHELYGGIWSQMIFGESFAESTALIDGFTSIGGKWAVEKINGACNAPSETWINLKTVMTDTSVTVYVNGDEIAQHTDPNPILSGCVGFRVWDSSAKFRNIRFSGNGNSEREISVPDFSKVSMISDMWSSVIRGTAEGFYELILLPD